VERDGEDGGIFERMSKRKTICGGKRLVMDTQLIFAKGNLNPPHPNTPWHCLYC